MTTKLNNLKSVFIVIHHVRSYHIYTYVHATKKSAIERARLIEKDNDYDISCGRETVEVREESVDE